MKKALSILLVFVLLLGLLPTASAMTVLSSQNLAVDGKTVDCEKYNIDGSNYFKLRDIAYLLNGTRAQFAVGWDAATQTVSILTKEAYSKNGTELDLSGGDKSATAKPSSQTLQIDGKTVTGLSVYNIGGNNYFKLRDLGNALGFSVGYDDATRTATIDSSAPAVQPAQPAPAPVAQNAEEIFKKCSPAVFYVEVYNAAGKSTASGSGFFIDADGTAVTNYHVIDGAYSAKILRSDTGAVCDVAGVYDYNKEGDWAVIKISGSGFPYLTRGDMSTVVGGAAVYAIGSPQGLDNTISEGIISNPSRKLGETTYIQTSAPISHGSSGGALINKYGEVIGITSAGIAEAENIGFALPISSIDNYKASSVTTLEALVAAANDAQREQALAILRQFVQSRANDAYANYPMYGETTRNRNGYDRYGLYLNTENNTVTLVGENVFDGARVSVLLSFSKSSYVRFASYFYYSSIQNSTWDFTGDIYLNAPTFNGQSVLLENVEGAKPSDELLDAHQQLAATIIYNALSLTETVLQSNGSSLRVFGFGS